MAMDFRKTTVDRNMCYEITRSIVVFITIIRILQSYFSFSNCEKLVVSAWFDQIFVHMVESHIRSFIESHIRY